MFDYNWILTLTLQDKGVIYYMENLGGVELLDAQTLSTCAKITSPLRTRESTNNNRSYVFPVEMLQFRLKKYPKKCIIAYGHQTAR